MAKWEVPQEHSKHASIKELSYGSYHLSRRLYHWLCWNRTRSLVRHMPQIWNKAKDGGVRKDGRTGGGDVPRRWLSIRLGGCCRYWCCQPFCALDLHAASDPESRLRDTVLVRHEEEQQVNRSEVCELCRTVGMRRVCSLAASGVQMIMLLLMVVVGRSWAPKSVGFDEVLVWVVNNN